ncbi:MAG: NAD(P)/FAD-dependent oxidoreductase [Solirubrobacteraceae bacterium]
MESSTVAVIGGGVVGAATACALARRGADVVLLEAADDLAFGASGTNSGILHSGFDSHPGALETQLILRGAALRDEVLGALGVERLRCGARVVPRSGDERDAVRALAENAARNGVPARLGDDGVLHVPGEHVCDPVAVVRALAGAAETLGARVRTGARVEAIEDDVVHAGGTPLRCVGIVNCAGLHADEVARLAGDDSFAIYPRKGEFLVFDRHCADIGLPVPRPRTKGVLVFPTLDSRTVVGPTAVDGEDKHDWSVRPEAREALLARAAAEGLGEPVAAYAGLRPAGRDGANYVIGPSAANPRLINVAAIRSTGLSASLGIAEHVCALVARAGVALGSERALPHPVHVRSRTPWWRRAADRSEAA